MKLYSIYALVDPRTDSIFYVGSTQASLMVRLGQHMADTRFRKSDASIHKHKKEFMEQMVLDGYSPLIRLIETVDESIVDEREKFYYFKYKNLGFKLLQKKGYFTNGKRFRYE